MRSSATTIGTDHQSREMMISGVNFMHYNYELAIEIKEIVKSNQFQIASSSFILASNNTLFEVLKVNFISGCLLFKLVNNQHSKCSVECTFYRDSIERSWGDIIKHN